METPGDQATAAEAEVVDLDFEKFLSVALAETPPDIADQLRAGLRKRYDKPPVEALELCLGRNVPLARARQLLFHPGEDDMRVYPDLIAMPPAGAPDSHPQRVVQVCSLASLYLVHSKSWETVRPFVEAGGLKQLALVLAHPNPYLASQAMSALMHITDEDLLFPWHDPPATPDGRGPRSGPYALVWRRMYELSSSSPFLAHLLAHYRPGAEPVFPGASGMALRLFAFYVSWMRRHFTQDGKLSLSSGILELLQHWAGDKVVSEDERQLANQLYQDFSRFPSAKATKPSESDAGASGTRPLQPQQQHHLGGLDGGDDEEPEHHVAAEASHINSGPSADNEAEQLKERGNEAYKRGDFSAAIHLYSSALDVLVPTERLLTEGPRRATYHANRAAAYMARAGAQLREGDADTAGHLEGVDHGSEGLGARHLEAAVLDCDMALQLDPTSGTAPKTCLRKARALQRLARAEEAAVAARTGLDKCAGGSEVQRELRALVKELEERVGSAPAETQAGRDGGKEAVLGEEQQGNAATYIVHYCV
eukprot:XP_001697442.1 predicted protein [Chlamydomonas reinhardtii]